MSPRLADFVHALPKAELHVHLEGSMTAELALRLAARHGIALPNAERGEVGLREAFRFHSFADFIRIYLALSSTLCRAADFCDVAVDLARRLALQNVRYAEVTVTPLTHVARGVPVETLLRGLKAGRAEAEISYGVHFRWVFDVVRSFPDQAEPTLLAALALEQSDPGSMAGLGVGGPEVGEFDMRPIAAMMRAGSRAGLRSLPHAGELAGPPSIWTAVRELGAHRLGHGVRCLEDPQLVEYLREHQIPLEVCPTSNVRLGVVENLAAHPLPRLLEAGVAVTLASDDPSLFETSLEEEYLRCAACFGWSAATVRKLALASIEHSSMPAPLAEGMREAIADVPDPPA